MQSARFALLLSIGIAPLLVGCNGSGSRGTSSGSKDSGPSAPAPDLTLIFEATDGGLDAGPPSSPACADNDSLCIGEGFGPTLGTQFPTATDPNPDPLLASDGVGRDGNGYLTLDASRGSFHYLWIANDLDWGRGTISKIDSKTIREVARYSSVTCSSLPTGNKGKCDGTNGCCAKDDFARWQARKLGKAQPPHQAVQLLANNPSRTAVDFNGDLFVANRAFGGQSSVSHIAHQQASCIDRNGNGKIDTSSDANRDGVIQTDCNNNNVPDDLDDTKTKPCLKGAQQEFFGLDDECILWTSNTNIGNQWGRPLALGPGDNESDPSDAFAGTFQDARFFRIDGTSGLVKDQWQLPGQCHPYGAAIDAQGVVWAPTLGAGPLCYFNTRRSIDVGQARDPNFGPASGYGVSLDRDQNIWQGGLGSPDAFRYVPDRTNGFLNLGNGFWTKMYTNGNNGGAVDYGFGIAADSRTNGQFFTWLAVGNGYIVRLPGSDLDKMIKPRADNLVDGSGFPATKVAGGNLRGVGVDADQNVWAISNANSLLTRLMVDNNGRVTPPQLNGLPQGNDKCPAGDVCDLSKDRGQQTTPYTYSDFTGFGLRNFARPRGTWSYIFRGCVGTADGGAVDTMVPKDTLWYAVVWDADVPANTTLGARVRSGKTPTPDATWGQWTPTFSASPANLRTGMPPVLQPNDQNDFFLQVEFTFTTASRAVAPVLKQFQVGFRCNGVS